MKSKFSPIFIVAVLVFTVFNLFSAFSQASNIADLLHFTAVARNANGQAIASSDISVQIQIYTGNPTQGGSTLEYCEVADDTTNIFGEFSLEFGPNPSSICTPFKFLKDVPWHTGNKWVNIGFREGNSTPTPILRVLN